MYICMPVVPFIDMRQRNESLIKTLGLTPLECDELWSNAQKQKNIEPGSSNMPCEGGAWTYIYVKRNTYFFVYMFE